MQQFICDQCPFRNSGKGVRGLHEERLNEIVTGDGTFACHKTTGVVGPVPNGGTKTCMGWLVFLVKEDNQHFQGQAARILLRIGMLDEAFIEKHQAEICDDYGQLVARHDWI